MAPPHEFQTFGQSGQSLCFLFPNIGGIADEICIVRSFHTEQINHDPAHTFLNTGTSISGRPSNFQVVQFHASGGRFQSGPKPVGIRNQRFEPGAG